MRNLPDPCVVVLVGPGAAGKSTWAATHFPPSAVVGSDGLRPCHARCQGAAEDTHQSKRGSHGQGSIGSTPPGAFAG